MSRDEDDAGALLDALDDAACDLLAEVHHGLCRMLGHDEVKTRGRLASRGLVHVDADTGRTTCTPKGDDVMRVALARWDDEAGDVEPPSEAGDAQRAWARIDAAVERRRGVLHFSDGVTIDTRGDYRITPLADGLYVTGRGLLCAVASEAEGEAMLARLRGETH